MSRTVLFLILALVPAVPGRSAALSSAFVYDTNNPYLLNRHTKPDGSYVDYGYDGNGDMTSMQRRASGGALLEDWGYEYSCDRFVKKVTLGGVTKREYERQGDSYMVRRDFTAGNEKRYVRDGDSVLVELDDSNQVTATYFGGGMDKMLSETRGGVTKWNLAGPGGSVMAVADVSGDIVSQFRYDAFGKRNAASSGLDPVANQRTFQGRPHDEGLGLTNFRNRWYDPETGRFAQFDRVEDGGSWGNPFNFAGCDPVNNGDPMGDRILYYDDQWKEYAKWRRENLSKPVQNSLGRSVFPRKNEGAVEKQVSWWGRGTNLRDYSGGLGDIAAWALGKDKWKTRSPLSEVAFKKGATLNKGALTDSDRRFLKMLMSDETYVFDKGRFRSPTGKESPNTWLNITDYLGGSAEQIGEGNATDKVTLLGTAGRVGLGLTGLDAPLDIKDLAWDFDNWEWSFGHVGQTSFDALALLPLVGMSKYGDEMFALAKSSKKGVNAIKFYDGGADVLKFSNEAGDIFSGMRKGRPVVIGENMDRVR